MDAVEIGKLIVPLAALAGIYLKLQSAMRQMAGRGEGREITNLPLHVQETSRPATMADVEMVARRVTKLEQQLVVNANLSATSHEKLLAKLDDIRDRMDDKLCSVTDRLQEIGRAVGRLEGS